MKFYTHHNVSFPAYSNSRSVTHLFYLTCNYGLALVLASAGIAKIVDASGLLAALQQLGFLSEGTVVLAATGLPVVELGLAAALFLQWKPQATLAASCLLFAGFLGFAIYGFYMGWSGNCGCFGGWAESGFGWGMMVRNGILLSLSVAALAACNKHLRKRD